MSRDARGSVIGILPALGSGLTDLRRGGQHERLLAYDLRHYAASVLIASGLSVKAVQRHLGHASAVTTLDTYAHLWPDAEDTTRTALEAGFGRVVSHACQANAV